MEFANKKRLKKALIFYGIVATLLLIRVGYIQILCHDELSAGAISQYQINIEGLDTRGMILDRNYMPLTGGTTEYYYFIDKDKEDNALEDLIGQIQGENVAESESKYYVFRTSCFIQDINKKLKDDYGAYVFQSQARYADEQIACHLIGYLNSSEKRGVAGLELMCEESLKTDSGILSLWADAEGNILTGETPKITYSKEDHYSFEQGIVTTIDRRIQYASEKALSKASSSGAIVVMDADTGEILAWVSSPSFNPNCVGDYLNSNNDCLINKVTQGAYAPGSVFKIVTAAAALESGITTNQKYTCSGTVTIENITLGCTFSEEGHGEIDMKQAMAVSCNCYFASLAKEIGYESVLEMAERMGYGKKVFDNFPEETSGYLPKKDEASASDTSNLSIGQGMILATPIQVAQMTAIVANGGECITPSIVKGEKVNTRRVINNETALALEEMLKEVIDSGSAKGDWKVDSYGKTGTAEVGSEDLGKYNCWFTGYCRLDDKKYVITVFVENGNSGSQDALPVFKEISQFLQSFFLNS